MTEEGIVISRDKDNVVIKISQNEACKSCNICETMGGGYRSIEAYDPLHVNIGDCVRVEVSGKKVIGASMLVFMVPLLFLIIGYMLGVEWSASHSEGAGIIGGITALVLSFVVVRSIDRSQAKHNAIPAQVIQILSN